MCCLYLIDIELLDVIVQFFLSTTVQQDQIGDESGEREQSQAGADRDEQRNNAESTRLAGRSDVKKDAIGLDEYSVDGAVQDKLVRKAKIESGRGVRFAERHVESRKLVLGKTVLPKVPKVKVTIPFDFNLNHSAY